GQAAGAIPLRFQFEAFLKKYVLKGYFPFLWARDAARQAQIVLDANPGIGAVFSTFPPLADHLAAMMLRRRGGLRWIADYRDPVDTGLNNRLVAFIERRMMHGADAIVANTGAAADDYRRRFPRASSKVHVITNGFDPEDRLAALPLPARDHRVLLHAGAMYYGRNANLLVAALAHLRPPGVRLALIGPVSYAAGLDEPLYRSAADEGWLEFVRESVPRAEAQRRTQEANGLVILQPQSVRQIPSKLFEYILIGRPILCLAPPRSAIEEVLARSGVPYVCLYSDDTVAEAAAKLDRYLAFPSEPTAPSPWFMETFDARPQAEYLARLLGGREA
ncbi:MAG TPA: hypothetical protein DEH78_16125, partial [Solibacterales bacterium]|nr:hypothetical protein [Bryobacterales bacterium]